MVETKVKAIVLKNVDYKEKDKLVTLFSLELGLINVVVKNCKSSAYKLKFAYSAFCFAEFELLKQGELYFLKNATLIDNLYDICEDYDKFVVGNAILELLLKCNKPLQSNEILFLNALKGLNLLANANCAEKVMLAKFMLGLLKVNGYKLNFSRCNTCGLLYVNKIFLNLEIGEFECGSCKSNYSLVVEKDVFLFLKKINSLDITNLEGVNIDDKTIKDSLKLLALNIENRFGIKLAFKSFL
ncbi:MAG: DNA repair protein RecO [Christensenellales bacterium]